jgi:hypothetical protein
MLILMPSVATLRQVLGLPLFAFLVSAFLFIEELAMCSVFSVEQKVKIGEK